MPEIFDSGWARRLFECLKKNFEVSAVTAGTMGETAVFDNFMEANVKVDRRKPSELLREMSSWADGVIIATYTPSSKKSHAFCWHLSRASTKPLVEVEAKSGVVIPWNTNSESLATSISKIVGLKIEFPPKFGRTEWVQDGIKYRKILGVDVGDYVLVNKVVIGKATSEEVILAENNGFLTNVQGLELKIGGLKKLHKSGKIDIRQVTVDTTTSLRSTYKEPRIVNTPNRKGVVFIDHMGYNVYDLAQGVEGAVVVGDDTTAIVGDLLFRLQVPIIGITDGDADGLLSRRHISPRSLIIVVKDDDSAGAKIFREIFKQKTKIPIKIEQVKDKILKLLENNIIKVLKK